MSLTRTDTPGQEPLALEEAKGFLRVEHDADDALIAALIRAARAAVEARTGRALMTRGFRLALDAWPDDGVVRVPIAPLAAIGEVAVADPAGDFVPVDGAAADLAGGRVYFKAPRPRPGVPVAGIRIEGTAGYGADPEDVPEALRLAVRLLVEDWYERRGGEGRRDMPPAVLTLIEPFREVRL